MPSADTPALASALVTPSDSMTHQGAPAVPEKRPEAVPDPEQLSHRIQEFSTRHPAVWRELQTDQERMVWLLTIFNFSHFLAEELIRHSKWIWSIGEVRRARSCSDYTENLAIFLRERRVATPTTFELALFRRKELMRLVVRDAVGYGSLAEITQELSDLADALLDCALSIVLQEIEVRFGRPSTEEQDSQRTATFTVLALGKLGGRELNYSSDIDLMFLYSGNGETSGPHKITNKEFFKKVANQLTNLLSTYTAAGLCYRVDLRLRPEGTLGEVCLPLSAAKEYYAKRARDWELQMLIKARVAAGDRAVGQVLLASVENAIYATTLDFSTIETMSEARERIGEKVARRKLKKQDLDVKLTRGGIRDIEFLAQCMQRLHGSRDASVRSGNTLSALSLLHEKGFLSETEWSRLVSAYRFLRHLEHRLQIEDDRQTHALPTLLEDRDRIARRMPAAELLLTSNVRPSALLLQALNQHLEDVQGIYDGIVHAQRPLYYSPAQSLSVAEAPALAVEHSPSPARFYSGFDSLQQTSPNLVARLRQRGIRRSQQTLTSFLERLVSQPEHLGLLDREPQVAEAVVTLFELSPYLSEQLTRRPELLAEVRRAIHFPDQIWPFEALAGPINDIEALRHFFRREMFRIQIGSVCFPEPVFHTLDRMSALAEFLVARAYRMAREQAITHARAHAPADRPFAEPQSEMMIVALGRLGMREFDLSSDADLLFIIPDSESPRQRFWTRVGEHLLEILTRYAGDGAVMSVDNRLRPNGREGMLVQTESKYVEYSSCNSEEW